MVRLDSGTQTIDGTEFVLHFQPSVLQVLQIPTPEPGDYLPQVLTWTYDNVAGSVHLSRGASVTNEGAVSGNIVLATIHFRAADTPGATDLLLVPPLLATSQGTNVLASSAGGTVFVGGATTVTPTATPPPPTATPVTPTATPPPPTPTATATPLTLAGHVDLEARPSPPHSAWALDLFRGSSGGITIYAVGGSTPLATFSATTDSAGDFSVTLVGISPGTYDLVVKGAHTLSNRLNSVTLPASGTVSFGTLREGDVNWDEVVDGQDISAMIPSLFKSSGDSGFVTEADLNHDGVVDGQDISVLIPAIFTNGPIAIAPAS